MPGAKSNRIRGFAFLAVLSAFFAFGGVDTAFAQEPPLTVPDSGVLGPASETAIPFNTWLLYPSLTLSSTYSDNYFLSPEAKISGPGFGADSKRDCRVVKRDPYDYAIWKFPRY